MIRYTLRPETARALAEQVRSPEESVESLLETAVRRFITERQRAKIHAEEQAFARAREQLLTRYNNHYIAMDEGEVVDHDVELLPLAERVRDRFGTRAILIRRVEETPEPTWRVRRPRVTPE